MKHDHERRKRFETLVSEVHHPLVRYLRRRASFADADDVMGDVLLTLWRRLEAVPEPNPLPWCYGVARRALANHRRGTTRRLQLVERLEAQPPATVDPLGAEEHPEVALALATLDGAERELISLWAWEGLEPHEIATVLATTPNAIRLRLSRTRKKLAAEILRHDPQPAGHMRVRHSGEQR